MSNLSIVHYMEKPAAPPPLLKQRHEEVLELLSRGLPYKEIGSRLGISERTVKYWKADIIRTIGLQEYRRMVYVNGGEE